MAGRVPPIGFFCDVELKAVKRLILTIKYMGIDRPQFNKSTLTESRTHMQKMIQVIDGLSRYSQRLMVWTEPINENDCEAYRQLMVAVVQCFRTMRRVQRSYRRQVLAAHEQLVQRLFYELCFREASQSADEREAIELGILHRVQDNDAHTRLGFTQWAIYYHVHQLCEGLENKLRWMSEVWNEKRREEEECSSQVHMDIMYVHEWDTEDQPSIVGEYRRRVEEHYAWDEDELIVYVHAMIRRDRVREDDTPVGQFWRVFNDYRTELYGQQYDELTDEQEIVERNDD